MTRIASGLGILLAAMLGLGCPRPEEPRTATGPMDWTTFQADAGRTGRVKAPAISSPRIAWKTRIGIQGWLNNPVIVGGRVYAASSGETWNQPDAMDGVYALSLSTGEIEWFLPAADDVNGLAYGDGRLFVTGDEGGVWAVNAADGAMQWYRRTCCGKVYSNPLVIEGLVVAGDGRGNLLAYKTDGDLAWTAKMNGAIRGGASSDGALIFAASAAGEVAAFDLQGREKWRTLLGRPAFDAGAGDEPAEIYGAPTVAGERVIVTFARDTYYDDPAVAALDKKSGRVAWRASDPSRTRDGWGNVRSSPAVYDDALVYGEPYSNEVVFLGLADGVAQGSVAAGSCMFPHYPSPVIATDVAYLGRQDGGLYAIDLKSRRLLWSLYLGSADLAGPDSPPLMPPGWEHCAWEPAAGSPIYATAAVSPAGFVVVGTGEGWLYGVAGD